MKGWRDGGKIREDYREGSQQLPLWLNLKYNYCEERDPGFLIPLISSGAKKELKPWMPAPSKPPNCCWQWEKETQISSEIPTATSFPVLEVRSHTLRIFWGESLQILPPLFALYLLL